MVTYFNSSQDFGAVLLREEIDKEEAVVAALLVDDEEVPPREEVTVVPPCHDLESCDDEEAFKSEPSSKLILFQAASDDGRWLEELSVN